MSGSSQRAVFLVALLMLFGTRAAVAQHEHSSGGAGSSSEFEVFLASEALSGSGSARRNDDDSWFNADIVLGLSHDQFRVFGEYFITAKEHDLERFQLGFEFVPETTLWLGRFHQPASAWNTEHHHGRYLQTAVTRPTIEDWEDEKGIIPQHITGALLESRRPLGNNGGIQFSGGIGASPSLSSDGYEPVTLLNNNPGKYGLSFSARLAYLPEYVGTSSFGVLFGHDQVFVRGPASMVALQSNHATLEICGAYIDWSNTQWRTVGALYYVDATLDRPARNESFVSGYFQAERQLPHQLTLFGRLENSAREQNTRYVALFDDHSGDIDVALRREVGGLRWDYARRQALSAEYAHATSFSNRADEWRLQWSAAVP